MPLKHMLLREAEPITIMAMEHLIQMYMPSSFRRVKTYQNGPAIGLPIAATT